MSTIRNIWSPKSVVIVFIKIDDGVMEFSAQLSGRKKKDFGVFDDLESLIKRVGKSKGYHVHVQGQGVLTRKVESLPNAKEQLIIGGNAQDFYFTCYDDQRHVSAAFMRRSVLEELEKQFEENKWHLLGVSCGEIPLCSFDKDGSFYGEYIIVLENGVVTSFERNPGEPQSRYREEVAQSIAKEYSALESSLDFFRFEEHELNYKEFTQFKVFGLSLLCGLLCMLVTNYFYQNYLNQSIAELEMELALSNENLSLLDRLDQEKTRKEQLVANAGVTAPKFLSYYLDEIGKTVPKTIDLQELYLFPLDGKLKNKKKVNILNDRIVLQGTSPDNVTLDDWIEHMDRFDWIQSIELLHYGKVSQKQAEFKLEITLSK